MVNKSKVLGREVWRDLHTIACFEPHGVGRCYLDVLVKHYPCEECRLNLAEKTIPYCVDTAEYFWRLHNQVNIDLGKPVFDRWILQAYKCEHLRERYTQDIKKHGSAPGDYAARLSELRDKYMPIRMSSVYRLKK